MPASSPVQQRPTPSGLERFLAEDELIVSKTDGKGRIRYANQTFQQISRYRESELLGRPHGLVRHPQMPACVFRLLWRELEAGREVFAHVLNLAKDGAHYWVFAHVTPSYDAAGVAVGYHSNRRAPSRAALGEIEPLYRALRNLELEAPTPEQGIERSLAELLAALDRASMGLNRFALSLEAA